MRVADSVALVTGAGRGLGRVLTRALVERGAKAVYAAARDPATVTGPGVIPVALDITKPDHVARVAGQCSDVSLLVNNAGVMELSPFLEAPAMDGARLEMETNYFGTLAMCRAFAPVLAANGGGALVNILSIVSWFTNPVNGSYCASKAAAWAMTNGVRIELARQGTLVVGVHAGFIDTDMAAALTGPGDRKLTPADVARQVFDAVEAGEIEVLADGRTRRVKAVLPRDHELIYPPLQAAWDAAHGRGVQELGADNTADAPRMPGSRSWT
jgi:NAD(P)-dependent dehydrogenase (short-subunit alcohol dehydrogenase family)